MSKKITPAFDRLSGKQKRVAIAQDVLTQLTAQLFIPEHTYCAATFSPDDVYKNMDLREALPKAAACRACAIGGMFLALARLRDAMPLHELATFPVEGDARVVDMEVSPYHITDLLCENGFDERDVQLLEDAFEAEMRREQNEFIWEDDEERQAAIKFGLRFKNDKNRMVAIMRNIVEHGNFKPMAGK